MNANIQRAREIFVAAVAKVVPEQWDAYLAEVCAGDDELRGWVKQLLAAHAEAGSFLEAPAAAPVTTVDEALAGEGPGTVIGPYNLLEPIGEGGFGIVFLAEQQQPVRRKVAVKILKPGMDTRQVIARFEADRQALALMDHANIARIFNGGATASGRPYFVMELVKGIPITDYCDQQQLTPRERLELFVHVCQAVQHAHQKGIIHRDLKPSNVLVTLHDGTPTAKVIDFGIAKATGQQLTDKTLFTGLAQLIGTPLYMSPEQAALSGLDVDTRSDIYSLGVLLYELLTGTTPFDQERLRQVGYDELRRIIREEEPPKPSTRISTLGQASTTVAARRKSDPKRLRRLLRGELDWIVMKCLEKDRNRRYEMANALAQDIEHYLRDDPVQACPPSTAYKLRKFARRNKGRLALAGLILLFCVLLGGGAGWIMRDRAGRLRETAQQVHESLQRARTLAAEKQLVKARQELAEARGRIGEEDARLSSLAGEIEAVEDEITAIEADVARFQSFLELVDRADEAEFPQAGVLTLQEGLDRDTTDATQQALHERDAAKAARYLLRALSCYGVLEQDDWSARLEGSLLEPEQVARVRRTVYEELLWLADDLLRRKEDHRSGREVPPPEAAQEGLAYLRQAEAAFRPTPAFYQIRARCHKALGQEGKARADEARAVQTPGTIALDHYLLGLAAYDARDKIETVKQFEAALRLEPTHYWSLIWLARYLVTYGEREQDFALAAAAYTGCIMKRPEHASAYLGRGFAYHKLHRYPEAISDCSKAIALDPTFATSWHTRGVAYDRWGDTDKALADFAKAIELDPTLVASWYHRGMANCKLGHLDKALADCSQAITLDPQCALAWAGRGWVYNKRDDPSKALADCSEALALDSRLAMAWAGRGEVHWKLGQLDKALADFSKAIEVDPKDAHAWSNRGAVHGRLGHLDKALADYSQAIALDPKDAHPWAGRGKVYGQLGHLDKALADISQAIALDPKDAQAWNAQGLTYEKRGDPNQALSHYSKAIALDPKYVEAWRNRGGNSSQLGPMGQGPRRLLESHRAGPQGCAGLVRSRGHLLEAGPTGKGHSRIAGSHSPQAG
jgi:serine/threonine protein kinase/Flp pilus assembly protein TadD